MAARIQSTLTYLETADQSEGIANSSSKIVSLSKEATKGYSGNFQEDPMTTTTRALITSSATRVRHVKGGGHVSLAKLRNYAHQKAALSTHARGKICEHLATCGTCGDRLSALLVDQLFQGHDQKALERREALERK